MDGPAKRVVTAQNESPTLPAGSLFGRYEILGALGAGGMGEVYRARDPRLGRDLAIKILSRKLSDNKLDVKRFEREAGSASALNHPNIVTIFERDSTYYIAMNWWTRSYCAKSCVWANSLQAAIGIAAQIAEGLQRHTWQAWYIGT
jgi:serine/threonine protein kinase